MKKIILALAAAFLILVQCQNNETEKIDLTSQPGSVSIFAAEIISTGLFERDIAITKTGEELIYTLGSYDQSRRCLVHVKIGEDGSLNKRILPFSGVNNDIEPFFSPDENKLYFASDRPMDEDSARSDYNIWVVENENGVWGRPKPLDTIINTRGEEYYPAVGRSRNLYFTASREDGIGREDIFISRMLNDKYQQPEALDSAINTSGFEFNAYINPDENLLVFSSFGRDDGLGGGDLYYSIKDNEGKWKPSINLGRNINSDRLDYCPFIDYHRNNFYFTSTRSEQSKTHLGTISELRKSANSPLNGMGNIYRISLDSLFIDISDYD